MNKVLDFGKVVGISFIGIFILGMAQGLSSILSSFSLYGFQYLLQGIAYVALTYVFLKLFVTKVLHKSLSELGITKFQVKREWLIISFALPMIIILVTVLLVPGNFINNNYTFSKNFSYFMRAFFFVGLSVGFVEEAIFRGLILSVVSQQYGKTIGIIIPSVVFGALHLLNGQLDLASFLLLLVGGTSVGIMFSLLANKNQTIWASMFVHSIWNFLMIGGICSFGLSKDKEAIATYVFKNDNFFLTGGAFGIEVSLFSILGFVAVILYLVYGRRGGE
ncbi:hypothetical protein IGI37_003148 [Enterococcus sp. AZ194]|uniref:CPBP family intramembrane glutamic endopeptidase n=1 Tax=Enterococcus sp. AZ194 TaxID=2774629 RepID=UPI003F22B381